MTEPAGRWRGILLIALAACGLMGASTRAQEDGDEILRLAAESWKEGTYASQEKAFEMLATASGIRPALPWLIEACRDLNPAIRGKAAIFLGQVHVEPDRVLPWLAALLKDPDPSVRSAAAMALAQFGRRAEGAMKALVEAVNAPSNRLCLGAEMALTTIGDAAIPELSRLLGASDPSRRARVLQGIQQGTSDGSWSGGIAVAISLKSRWIELAHDPHPMVRAQLAKTLAMLPARTPPVLAALRVLMEDTLPEVRVVVVTAVGSTNRIPNGLRGPFLKRLADPDRDVRANAAEAIPQPELADPVVIDWLLKLLKDPQPRVRAAAGAKLAEARRMVFTTDPQGRQYRTVFQTSRALIQHPTAGLTLLAAMEDTRPDVRRSAAALIPAFPAVADRAVPLLIRQLGDHDPRVRAIAAGAIGQLRPAPETAVRPLLAIVTGRDATTEEGQPAAIAAATALVSMGGPARAKGLRLVLGRLKAGDEPQRDFARQALTTMGPLVIDDLVQIAADPRTPRALQVEAASLIWPRATQDDSFLAARSRRAAVLDTVPTFRSLANDGNPQTRMIALALLAAIDPSDASVASLFLEYLRSERSRDDQELGPQWTAYVLKPPMIPTLVIGLEDEDSSVRFETLKILQGLAESLAVLDPRDPDRPAPPAWTYPGGRERQRELGSLLARSLLPCLTDREFRVRWAAAETLGIVHAEPMLVIPALVKIVKTEGGRLPVDGLTFRPFQLDYILGHSDKGTDPLRMVAIRALGAYGREAAGTVPVILPFLKDEDPRVCWYAAEALANIGPEARDAVPALIEALQSDAVATGKDEENYNVLTKAPIRLIAAYALARIGPDARAAVPALTAALSGPDSRVRLTAAGALGRMGAAASPSVPDLVRLATRGSNIQVAVQAAESLRQLGPIARKELIAAMHDHDVEVRVNALGVLTDPRGATVVPVAEIARCLDDPDPQVRVAAASALSLAAARPEAVAVLPRLVAALGDRDSEVVAAAANAVTCVLRPLMIPIPAIVSPAHPFRPEPDDGFEWVESPTGEHHEQGV
ncbi:MAG: HEAT repeat domain-containing protein [Isosphaeraceae bacterium]